MPNAEARVGIPGVRRLERDGGSRHLEAVDGELIDLGVRLVDADLLDREHRIDQRLQAGCLDDRIEHLGRAVRQDRGPQARLFQACEDIGDFGNGIERQVKIHQAIAQAWFFEPQRLQREVESVPGDLPEIRVPALAARSQVYCSCLSRQSAVSLSMLSPSTSRQPLAAAAKSNSVPFRESPMKVRAAVSSCPSRAAALNATRGSLGQLTTMQLSAK